MMAILSRADRRHAARVARHKPARRDKTSMNPVIRAVIESDFKKRFSVLKVAADQQCIGSDNVTQIIYNAGVLLFVTIRALELDQLEIEDESVKSALQGMGSALAEANELEEVSSWARKTLIDGMDYLDALVKPLSKEALAVAWWEIDTLCRSDGVGTKKLEEMMEKITK